MIVQFFLVQFVIVNNNENIIASAHTQIYIFSNTLLYVISTYVRSALRDFSIVNFNSVNVITPDDTSLGNITYLNKRT